MNNTKPRCRNCEYANSKLVKTPFVFCYVKMHSKLRCSRCKSHRFKMKDNVTNTL